MVVAKGAKLRVSIFDWAATCYAVGGYIIAGSQACTSVPVSKGGVYWLRFEDMGVLKRDCMHCRQLYGAVHLDLFFDPSVGSFHSFSEWEDGFPVELFEDEVVVGVSASDSEGAFDVPDSEVFVRYIHYHLS